MLNLQQHRLWARIQVLFALNWFDIVHIPFLDVPDITADKQQVLQRSEDVVQRLD